MFTEPARAEQTLREHDCWFSVDVVRGNTPVTTFKRLARLRQDLWRRERGLPIGAEPMQPTEKRPHPTPVGSRVELAHAERTAANVLTPAIAAAVRTRIDNPEPHQTLSRGRLHADLLSSQPMSFNLFGELAADRQLATRVLGDWVPGGMDEVLEIRFEHSPGRLDAEYLGNRTAFDVSVEGRRDDDLVFLGIETKYHEHPRAEKAPKRGNRPRYWEVTDRSGLFPDDWQDQIAGRALQQIWLDHLLALSMLRSEKTAYVTGVFVLMAPQSNPAWEPLADDYRALLTSADTFQHRTLESVVDAIEAQTDHAWIEQFRNRYLDLSEAVEAVGGVTAAC
jgi:hypothetical protein